DVCSSDLVHDPVAHELPVHGSGGGVDDNVGDYLRHQQTGQFCLIAVHAPVLEGAGSQMAGLPHGGGIGPEPALDQCNLSRMGTHDQKGGVVVEFTGDAVHSRLGDLSDALVRDLRDTVDQSAQGPLGVGSPPHGASIHEPVGVHDQSRPGGQAQIRLVVDDV